MATTSPDNIWTPDSGDAYALTVDLASTADTVQEALNNQAKKFSSSVTSAAQRNALFPSPAQGNRVFRTDLGYEETYLAIYNVTTNPGGASSAGWYPTRRVFTATRTGTQSLASGWNVIGTAMTSVRNDGLGTFSSGAFTVTAPGAYRISAKLYLSALSPQIGLELTKNATTPNSAGALASTFIQATSAGVSVTTTETLAAGDVIRALGFTVNATTVDTAGSRGAGLTLERIA